MQLYRKKRVAFQTLGCKLNFSETSSLARMFDKNKYEIVDFKDKADIYIINTCTVTSNADKKSRNTIYRAIKKDEKALVVAVGCYTQLHAEELSNIEGIDLILGSNEKFKLVEHIENYVKTSKQTFTCDHKNIDTFLPAFSSGDRTRSFLKIQDGCDYFCTYCAVPYARGRSRNMPILDIIKQAREIADKGIKEITLTGVNIGDFGKTSKETFFDLIKELDKVDGIERYRISSIEPNLLTDAIIDFVAISEKFMPHFHIPLQSGSNKILSLMKRKYQRELFSEKLNSILKKIPDAGIGADVIIGFPGETDNDFNDTLEFIKTCPISYLHVFTYSERQGTIAAEMKDKLSPKIKSERADIMHKMAEEIKYNFAEKNLGSQRRVLFENFNDKGKMYGFTDNYIKTQISFKKELANNILEAKLIRILENGNTKVELI